MSWRAPRGPRTRWVVALGRSGYAFVRGRLVPSAAGHGRALAATPVYATPLVRKIAGEYEVDLVGVVGTGAGGRIRPVDVRAVALERTALFPRAAALVALALERPFDEVKLMLQLFSDEEREALLIAALEVQTAAVATFGVSSMNTYRERVAGVAADMAVSRRG